MKRIAMFAVCVFLTGVFPTDALAQDRGSIEGTIRLESGEPVHLVTVLLTELGRVVESDDLGRYRFEDVPPGVYEVQAFQSLLSGAVEGVEVTAGETRTMDIEVRLSAFRQQITVTATGRQENTFDAVQSVTSLDAFDLSELMAPSLGEVLDGQLGISKRSFGSGNARPVVRGFDGDRILVMQDSMPVGALGSQSGDHAEPVDVSNLERLEVLKGPATLLYGSNAIGGVVNAISSHQAFHEQSHEGFSGQVSSSVGSANGQAGSSFNLEYGVGRWAVWAGGGGQRTRDYDTPIGVVDESRSRVTNGSAGFGWFGDRAFASVGYRGNEGRYGIPFVSTFEGGGEEGGGEEEELDAVNVALREHTFNFAAGVRNLGTALEEFRLSVNYSDYNHDEIEIFTGGEQEVGTTFENQQIAYRGVFTQRPWGRLSGSFGFSGQVRQFDTAGEEAIAPPVDQNAFSVFTLQEAGFEGVQFQFGGRVERTRYEPQTAGFPTRSLTGFSGGLGARFDLWEGGALVANYTDSFRSPALEELYNFGPHLGNLTFEIGDPDLGRERSHGLDFSLRHESTRLRGEANFFYYDMDNFVFLAPTGAVEDGLNEAEYSQGDARFLGTELKLDVGVHENLWLNLAMDSVDTELKESSLPIPRIPPLRGTIGVDIRYGGLSIRPQLVMADARRDTFTTETPTAGYVVGNLKASYTIPRQHFSHHLSAEVFNIGDVLYRNHVSFIKDLAPEIGRGVRFSYAVKFF